MSQDKILFLSDIHLLKDKDEKLLGCNTFSALQSVVDHIKANHGDASTVFLMGDLSQDGTPESYIHLKNILHSLNVPRIYIVPGNHDNKQHLYDILNTEPFLHDKVVEMGSWAFVLLDTTLPPHDYGYLAEEELNFLRHTLESLRGKHVIILMHHHPFSVYTPLIDEFILKNSDEFIAVLSEYTHVTAILFGHVHQALQGNMNHLTFMSCPATCFQFVFGTKKLSIDLKMMGYRWLYLEGENFISGTVATNAQQCHLIAENPALPGKPSHL